MARNRILSLTHLGWGLAIPVLFLCTLGLACIHVTDRDSRAHTAGRLAEQPPAHPSGWLARTVRAVGELTGKQAFFLVTGGGLMFLVLRPPYQRLGRLAYPFYGAVIVLLAFLVVGHLLDRFGLPSLPFVSAGRRTYRWIGYGAFRIQPSEFMKLALVLALARYLRYRHSYRRWPGLIPPFLLTLLPMILILFQPDLGTLLMLLPVLFTMLFVAGARLHHLVLIILAGCATMPLFYYYGMTEYQRERIDILFRQGTADESWHLGEGYQLRQAKTALGTGGLSGTGYGEGVFVQYDLLPEEHNDFIFAIVGHQWGLVGGILVILAYGAIVLFGLEVATATHDPFGRLLAVGVVVMIVAQALLNICMNIGLAPITGMPLPFVSSGGSSLWTNFLGLGLLVNVAQHRPMLIAEPPFVHDDE